MPVTLLLIKLEKQAIHHWKANKHAHITKCVQNISKIGGFFLVSEVKLKKLQHSYLHYLFYDMSFYWLSNDIVIVCLALLIAEL